MGNGAWASRRGVASCLEASKVPAVRLVLPVGVYMSVWSRLKKERKKRGIYGGFKKGRYGNTNSHIRLLYLVFVSRLIQTTGHFKRPKMKTCALLLAAGASLASAHCLFPLLFSTSLLFTPHTHSI